MSIKPWHHLRHLDFWRLRFGQITVDDWRAATMRILFDIKLDHAGLATAFQLSIESNALLAHA